MNRTFLLDVLIHMAGHVRLIVRERQEPDTIMFHSVRVFCPVS